MNSTRMRDRSRVFDKDKPNDAFNVNKTKTLTDNFIIACSRYIYIHVVTVVHLIFKRQTFTFNSLGSFLMFQKLG